MRRIRLALALIVALLATIVPPMPAQADFALLTLTGNPLTSASAPYLVLTGMAGQSACVLTINTAGGTMAVEGLYKGTSTWTPALVTVSPDGTTTQASETAAGSYVFNCASMVAIRVDGSAASGTPSVTLNASGGVGRILGAGVNGGRTIVAGNSPITVTNSGNTATISCTGCGAGPSPTPVSVQAGTGIGVATPSPGVFVISSTITPAPAATPVSVQAGTNTTIGTPSPGVFIVNAIVPSPAPTVAVTSTNTNLTVTNPSTNVFTLTAVTPAPPSITGTGIATVTNPSLNTYVVSVPSSAPAVPVNITSSNTNLTVATPSANTFVLTAVTPAPAPTVGITTTNLAVTNPSTNVFTLSTTGSYTAPITTPTFGCASYNVLVSPTYQLTGDGFSCTSVTAGTFVIPTAGTNVSVPIVAGFSIYQKYTPITITDGTNMVGALVATATTATSTAMTVTVFRVNFGASGNTMANGAEIITGGYDAGAGTGTISTISGGANISVTSPNGPTSTVALVASPSVTNLTASTLINVGTAGAGSVNEAFRVGSLAAGGYTNLLSCPLSQAACTAAGVYGSGLVVNSSSNNPFYSTDTSGNFGTFGYIAAGNLPGSGGPYCLQSGALSNVQGISATSGPCSTVTGVTGTGNISVATGTTTPVVSETNAPTWTGLATAGNLKDTGLASTSVQCLQGASGTNVSQTGQGCTTVYLNGAIQSGTQAPHIEQFNNTPTVANGATRTYTFTVPFLTAPVCQVQQSGAGVAPTLGGTTGLYPSPPSTTSVVINNNSGATQTPYVSCIGL